ncbi:MAG TPA: iron dependent repressor, metal binding and dimerization domain protein [Verrucomicrobiae bacterium]|nr:iron dependent repressor, metal binding and dimerization domain protein [Verrucomicrobiae bacterium]
MRSKTAVSVSQQDYLERIQDLMIEKGYARVSDIARELNLSRPSVSVMIKQLGRLGYLKHERYRGFALTERGRRVAQGIRLRHQLLTRFLLLLGIDVATVARDVEGIEHHISDASLARIRLLCAHLEKHPMDGRAGPVSLDGPRPVRRTRLE